MSRSFLLVKTSSLGDVVHNLPVASDLRAVFPGCRIDWVVEAAFADIPRLHPGVGTVIPCALRRWRKSLLRPGTWREIGVLRSRMRETEYDAVLDTQGLLKSALVARMARGVRHGLDWRSSREPLSVFYDHVHAVPWGSHAVQRNRVLVATALGYALPGTLDFGIEAPSLDSVASESAEAPDPERPWLPAAQLHDWLPSRPYAVLLHASSAESKLWPAHQWKKLIAHLDGEGIASVLPWGGAHEKEAATQIASGLRGAVVAPRLSIRALAAVLGRAQCCIGVDTGLTHLAAALGRPTVGIYVSTDPAATGVHAPGIALNVGGRTRAPSLVDVLAALKAVT